MTETTVNKNLEQQLRRALHKHGYSLHKLHPDQVPTHGYNLGGYMIVLDKYNACVAGPNYDLDLDDVADWVKNMCG